MKNRPMPHFIFRLSLLRIRTRRRLAAWWFSIVALWRDPYPLGAISAFLLLACSLASFLLGEDTVAVLAGLTGLLTTGTMYAGSPFFPASALLQTSAWLLFGLSAADAGLLYASVFAFALTCVSGWAWLQWVRLTRPECLRRWRRRYS
jgi:Zn-dependent protease with chaperone function